MIRRPPRSTPLYSSAASDVYKRQPGARPGPRRCRPRRPGAYGVGPRVHRMAHPQHRAGRALRPAGRPEPAGRLDRRAARVPGREGRCHPVGVRQGAQRAGTRPPRAVGRVGGPRRLQQHLHGRRAVVPADPAQHQGVQRQPLRPHPALRHPRARDGFDPERHRAARWHPPLRRHLPGVQRLHEAGGAPGRAHADPRDVRLDARLDRPRRGRANPPAGGAPGGAARDPRARCRPAGRRERDRLGMAHHPVAHPAPRRSDPDPAERADLRTGHRRRGRHPCAGRRRRRGGLRAGRGQERLPCGRRRGRDAGRTSQGHRGRHRRPVTPPTARTARPRQGPTPGGRMTNVSTPDNAALPAPIARLRDEGVAIWLDDLSRELLSGGELARLVRQRGVVGVTSNPTIFASAMAQGQAYDDQLRALAAAGTALDDTVLALMTQDVRDACDLLAGLHRSSGGLDGRVSLEVAPSLARDTGGTVAMAKQLWTMVDRPNLYIKIPATAQGLPAIADATAAGINVNVTLIFSLDRYRGVLDAYHEGLERARTAGHDLARIDSVASFFVSRVDTAVDKRLDAIGTGKAAALRGTIAIANARLAYRIFAETTTTDRWQDLAATGARPQRPLWASTSVKDPSYSDTRYVDAHNGRCGRAPV